MYDFELAELKKNNDYEFGYYKAENSIWPMWLCWLFVHPWQGIGTELAKEFNTYYRVCSRCGRFEVWKFKNRRRDDTN